MFFYYELDRNTEPVPQAIEHATCRAKNSNRPMFMVFKYIYTSVFSYKRFTNLIKLAPVNKYIMLYLFLVSSAVAEPTRLLCEEDGKVLDRRFSEELTVDIDQGVIQSSYTTPGNLEIVNVTEKYITAVNVFGEVGGGIVLVLDRITGEYIWSGSSPYREAVTDEHTLRNSSYEGKCVSAEPIL